MKHPDVKIPAVFIASGQEEMDMVAHQSVAKNLHRIHQHGQGNCIDALHEIILVPEQQCPLQVVRRKQINAFPPRKGVFELSYSHFYLASFVGLAPALL